MMNLQPVTDINITDAGIVYSKSWQASHQGIVADEYVQTHTPAYKTKALYEELENKDIEVYLLSDNQIPVGIIILNVKTGEIKSLYIAPDFWGKGYGTHMLDFAVNRLRSFQTIFLIVMNQNRKARRFYENYGFAYSGEEKILSVEKGLSELTYLYALR